MRPRTQLVLLVVVLALLGFIFLVEREMPSSEERRALARRVLALEEEVVESITVAREGMTVRLVRGGDEAPAGDAAGEQKEEDDDDDLFGLGETEEWRLVEPFDARADAAAADRLARGLAELEKERTLEDLDAEAAGLADPRATVTLTTAEGERTLLVGRTVPGSSNMIVQLEGEEVAHVVPDTLWTELSREPGDWRSKELFDAQRSDIDRIRLSTGDGRVLLARRGERFWIEAPLEDRADPDLTATLLSTLTGLRAVRFVDDPERPLEEMGLAPPRGVVEVFLEGREEPYRIEWGGPVEEEGENRFARVEGRLVEIPAALQEALERDASEWQSRAWSSLETYQVDRVEIRDAGGETVLVREDGDWTRDGVEIDWSAASDFLYALAGARAERLLAPGEARERGVDLESPRLTVRLVSESHGEEVLELLPSLEEGSPAVSEGREHLLLLGSEDVGEVEESLTALRRAPARESEEVPEEAEAGESEEAGEDGEPSADPDPDHGEEPEGQVRGHGRDVE